MHNPCNDKPINQELTDIIKALEGFTPYWKLLGIKIIQVSRDCASGAVDIEEKHLQVLGTVHGGVHASLTDAMAWVAIISHYYPEYVNAVTIDLTVKYLKPTTQGRLTAIAKIDHIKEPLALITAELRNNANELVGITTTTYWITRTGKNIKQFVNEIIKTNLTL